MSVCIDDVPAYSENECGDYLLTGIGDIAVIALDHQFTDFTDPSQWTAEIAAGRVTIIKDVKGNYPSPSAIEQDVPSNRSKTQKVTGLNHVLNIEDGNVSAANDVFHAALTGKKTYIATYNVEEEQILVNVTNPVTWLNLPASDDSANAWQLYNATAKWFSKPDVFMTRYNAPTGIFD